MSVTDPGLQPQRTALAWSRTSLALFVNALLALRAGTQGGQRLIAALGVVLLVAAAGAIACGVWRRHRLMQPHPPAAPPVAVMLATVIVTWLACITGVASILLTARG